MARLEKKKNQLRHSSGPDRIPRVNEVLRQELSQLLLTEVELPAGSLATITEVETSKDLRHARIWISVLPANVTGSALEALRRAAGTLQHHLTQRLSMKPLPRIHFAVDDNERRAEDIEQLLDRLRKEGS